MTHVLIGLGAILFALACAGVLWVHFIGELAADLPEEESDPPHFPSVSGAGHMGAITPEWPKAPREP